MESSTYIKQVAEENEKGAVITGFAIVFNDLTKTSHLLRHPGVRYLASNRGLTAFHWFSITEEEKDLSINPNDRRN